MSGKIESFYDSFSHTQEEIGINARNHYIHKWLLKFGLHANHSVLEIGCGIGTQTQLLYNFKKDKGNILAVDISLNNIKKAQQSLKHAGNIEFVYGDIIDLDISKYKFDIIILPDVLEHIPIKSHKKLFEKLKAVIKDTGFILIHIPNPYYLDWCHKNKPELLQIIDQPIYTNFLVENVYPDFYIYNLKTYSIWVDNHDYQLIVLKPNVKQEFSIIKKKSSLLKKIKGKLSAILKK